MPKPSGSRGSESKCYLSFVHTDLHMTTKFRRPPPNYRFLRLRIVSMMSKLKSNKMASFGANTALNEL